MITTGLVLALAWFAAVNACASILSWVLATGLSSPQREKPRLLLAIRLFPAIVSIAFAGVLFAPSHWALEPREAKETLGLVLYVLASAGLFLLTRSTVRTLAISPHGNGIGVRRSKASGPRLMTTTSAPHVSARANSSVAGASPSTARNAPPLARVATNSGMKPEWLPTFDTIVGRRGKPNFAKAAVKSATSLSKSPNVRLTFSEGAWMAIRRRFPATVPANASRMAPIAPESNAELHGRDATGGVA